MVLRAPSSAASLRRAALLGAATGSRSTFGLAALGLTARTGWPTRPPVRIAAGAAAAAECVIDKLPVTPSRLQVRGLVSRLVLGSVCGALATYPSGRRELATGVAVGGSAALAVAVIGSRWRRFASGRTGLDLPGAVAEDIASATLALLGARGI